MVSLEIAPSVFRNKNSDIWRWNSSNRPASSSSNMRFYGNVTVAIPAVFRWFHKGTRVNIFIKMRITGCLFVVAVQADIRNKLLLGYQGWFGAPGDGSEDNKWRHWSSGTPTGKTLTVDMHPDLSRGFKWTLTRWRCFISQSEMVSETDGDRPHDRLDDSGANVSGAGQTN